MTTNDRAILKLARAEYHRRASLMGEPMIEAMVEPTTPTRRKRSRKLRVRTTQSVARRKAKRLLARNEEVPVQLLRAGWPTGKARKPEVQRLLESTGLAETRKVSTVRGRRSR